MSDDKPSGPEKAVGMVTQLVKAVPVYEDAIQPAARELGKGLEIVVKAVNLALEPLAALIWGYDKIRDFVQTRVAEKLAHVPPERILPPPPQVAGPALEALRWTGHEETLRELYANLLASSLDSATAHRVHPAFVDIIKNMAPDEAKLMRLFAVGDAHPLLDVRIEVPNGYLLVRRNLSLLGQQAGCHDPDLVPSYLDNLVRLGLLEIPQMIALIRPGAYEPLEAAPAVETLRQQLSQQGHTTTFERKVARLTDLGSQFCLACVIDPLVLRASQQKP